MPPTSAACGAQGPRRGGQDSSPHCWRRPCPAVSHVWAWHCLRMGGGPGCRQGPLQPPGPTDGCPLAAAHLGASHLWRAPSCHHQGTHCPPSPNHWIWGAEGPSSPPGTEPHVGWGRGEPPRRVSVGGSAGAVALPVSPAHPAPLIPKAPLPIGPLGRCRRGATRWVTVTGCRPGTGRPWPLPLPFSTPPSPLPSGGTLGTGTASAGRAQWLLCAGAGDSGTGCRDNPVLAP